MAGVYIHIPFCRHACTYCDFHFSTSLKNEDRMIQAIKREIQMRLTDYGESVETIYFGGGTPSAVRPSHISDIIREIRSLTKVVPQAEITLETNPDDHDLARLNGWRNAGVNRLSIGVQAFDDDLLKWMNRSHSGEHAATCVEKAKAAGFDNITMDLIYGLPESKASWLETIQTAAGLGVNHISAYALTVEDKTVLAHQVKNNKIQLPDSNETAEQFLTMIEVLSGHGFNQYEVSNFALEGCESKHNSAYWSGTSYVGIGPSAHSYDGAIRSWNISNNAQYMKALEQGKRPFEEERLLENEKFNELVLTGLRTVRGVSKAEIEFMGQKYVKAMEEIMTNYTEYAEPNAHFYKLNSLGLLLADRIASDAFILD